MKKQISVLLLILVLCVCLFAGMAKADVIEIEEYWEEFFYTHHEDCETVNTYYTVNTKGGETKVREDASRLSKTLLEIPNGEEVFIKFIYHVPNGSDWGFWLDDRVMGEYHTEALWILMNRKGLRSRTSLPRPSLPMRKNRHRSQSLDPETGSPSRSSFPLSF